MCVPNRIEISGCIMRTPAESLDSSGPIPLSAEAACSSFKGGSCQGSLKLEATEAMA